MSEWLSIEGAGWQDDGYEYRVVKRRLAVAEPAAPAAGGLRGAAQAVRDAPPAQPARTSRTQSRSTRGAPAQARVDIDVNWTGEAWEVECPEHGWHKAVQFDAEGNRPAVVKCTGKTSRGYCDVKVPLEVAERKAGGR